jgi:hypothetical protein
MPTLDHYGKLYLSFIAFPGACLMSTFSRRSVLSLFALAIASAATAAQAAPASGMLLGVYAFENFRGLRITGTIPGYSAEGRLFAGDVLLQATTDGSAIYSIRTMREFEWAKDQIGPSTPAALEVWRPGVGKIYFWVEFLPVGGAAAVRAYAYESEAGDAPPAPVQMKAQFKTEAERPGARALFNGGGNPGLNGGQGGNNGGFEGPIAPPPVAPGRGNPGSLFGR